MKIQADVYLTTLGEPPLPNKWDLFGWRAESITQKQKSTLEEYGVAYSRVKYKGQASMLIQLIFNRAKNGLATPKQIQVLLKNGYTSARIAKLTKRGASRIISRYFKEE